MSTPKKVLVVDDEAHIVHVVALKLRNAGYDVRTASDGEEALELATKHPPDMLITDLQMPYLDGLSLCARLKKQPSTSAVPALMLTARGHAIEPEALAATNIRKVLGKPFSPREVLELVEQILGEASPSAAPAPEAKAA